MVAWPPLPRFHSAEVLPEFIVWLENPAGNWLQLPRFFADDLPVSGPGGLWLQAEGCCSRASWVAGEVSVAGNIALTRGWQTFARACGLGGRCTIHFKYDDDATLDMKVFREDGRCVRCCPEVNDGEEVLDLGDGRDDDEGEPALGPDHASSSYGGSSSGDNSSSGGYTSRRARFEGGGGSSHRRASVKHEEGSG